jgi:hypothetical protein
VQTEGKALGITVVSFFRAEACFPGRADAVNSRHTCVPSAYPAPYSDVTMHMQQQPVVLVTPAQNVLTAASESFPFIPVYARVITGWN